MVQLDPISSWQIFDVALDLSAFRRPVASDSSALFPTWTLKHPWHVWEGIVPASSDLPLKPLLPTYSRAKRRWTMTVILSRSTNRIFRRPSKIVHNSNLFDKPVFCAHTTTKMIPKASPPPSKKVWMKQLPWEILVASLFRLDLFKKSS